MKEFQGPKIDVENLDKTAFLEREELRVRRGKAGRRLVLAGLTGGILTLCYWLAFNLRFDFNVPDEYARHLRQGWALMVAFELACLFAFRHFSGIYKYFSMPEMRQLFGAICVPSIALLLFRDLRLPIAPPAGVIFINAMLSFLVLGAMRTSWRLLLERSGRSQGPENGQKKVAVIGAGDAGAGLVRALYARPKLGIVPVAFFDDDPSKWGSRIHGLLVMGPPEFVGRKAHALQISEVVIAIPSTTAKRLGEVVSLLQQAALKYVTVPSIDQLTSGSLSISQLRPVKIEDLLGREAVDLHLGQIGHVLKGRAVMVTGAGGSIGSELCRQVASFGPSRILLVEQSEVQLFQIEQELIKLGYGEMVVPIVADILDCARMDQVLRQHRPATIFHAAAHKHVNMMERQPSEAIKNNSLGTAFLAELAAEHEVERFVMISTDKAVNPTSVMGASKRLAEIFLGALARDNPRKTRFVAVRFGNVLGSSGSVVPIFEKQIAEGGPITVTHPEVVRYFMTIPEAVGLVLQSAAQGKGGEIYVLDMGKPVKIAELARQMIKLSGLEPDRDIEIKFTGLRPGEKLYEELHNLRARCTDTAHPRIKRLTGEPAALKDVWAAFGDLTDSLPKALPDTLKILMKQLIPEYTPALSAESESNDHLIGGAALREIKSELEELTARDHHEEGEVSESCCERCASLALCAKRWALGSWSGGMADRSQGNQAKTRHR